MSMKSGLIAAIFVIGSAASPALADVITDWNEKAVALVGKHRMLPPQAERVIACVHLAMFDAVNSIEPRYKPYRVSLLRAQDNAEGCCRRRCGRHSAGEIVSAGRGRDRCGAGRPISR